jgi:hypothetical protein
MGERIESPSVIKRDRWDRPLLAHPVTGEILTWDRPTSLAKIAEDSTALDRWKARNIAFGIGRRPALFALAASVSGITDASDRKTLDQVVRDADILAGGSEKAQLGTAIHGFIQNRIMSPGRFTVPEQWEADVDAYEKALKVRGLWPYEDFVERLLITPEVGAAGTTDCLMTGDFLDLPVIADIKTGSVKNKAQSFAIQFAIYAHATHWVDERTGAYHEMPEINKKIGLIIHVPVGESRCDIHELDLVAGWEAAKAAASICQWRRRKDLVRPYDPVEYGIVEVFSLRLEWLRNRVQLIADHSDAARERLGAKWLQLTHDIPTFLAGGPRDHDEISRIAALCDLIETDFELTFPSPDPINQEKTK